MSTTSSVRKEGDPDCDHQWVTDNKVYASMPPQWYRICEDCGRVERRRGEMKQRKSYKSIYDKFHGE